MKFLFIVTSYWAYGELQIAIDFATKVLSFGHKVLFVIPPSHEKKVKVTNIAYRILIPNGTQLNRILLYDIEDTFKPTFVILSDFLNYVFCEKHYGLTENDLSIFSGKVGAFDLYNFALAGKKIDTYGFRAKEISKISIEKYDFLLQPCPVNHLSNDSDSNSFRYRIFDDLSARTESEYYDSRVMYGIKSSDKLIVMTGAVWQSSFKPYTQVKEMVSGVYDTIIDVLTRLPSNFKVCWVGPRYKEFLESLRNVSLFDNLEASKFEKLVDGADIFISINYISTSMLRASLRGVPIVLMGNSFLKRDGETRSLMNHRELMKISKMNTVYPFRMFPVGWYSFLEPVVRNNPFYKLVNCSEVFDEDEIYDSILKLSELSFYEALEKLEIYKKQWNTLPNIESIVTSMNDITKK